MPAAGLRSERKAIQRPSGDHFGSESWPGLRQLNERAAFAIVVIEPEIAAEDLLVPVGALGLDDDRLAVGRKLKRPEIDRVEELVEGKFGLLSQGSERTTYDHHDNEGSFLDSHLGSRWEEGLYIAEFIRSKFVTRGYGLTPQHPQQRSERGDGELKVRPSRQWAEERQHKCEIRKNVKRGR